MLAETTFDAGDVVINYVEGPPSGPPVLFLHGATARWQDLRELITDLDETRHVYACDQRGHGKSGWGTSYRVADLANDASNLIRGVIGTPTALVGHSSGALVSFAVAAQLPDLISSIVVIDPPLFLREESVKTIYVNEYFQGVYDYLAGRLRLEELFATALPDIDEQGRRYLEETFSTLDPAFVKVHLDDRFLDGTDLTATLQAIACPTLLAYGEIDKGGVVRDRDVEFFLDHVATARAIQIKDAGHLIHVDQPELLKRLVREGIAPGTKQDA
jgi:pimeloyl-ACP methyl ester carboxylesterase